MNKKNTNCFFSLGRLLQKFNNGMYRSWVDVAVDDVCDRIIQSWIVARSIMSLDRKRGKNDRPRRVTRTHNPFFSNRAVERRRAYDWWFLCPAFVSDTTESMIFANHHCVSVWWLLIDHSVWWWVSFLLMLLLYFRPPSSQLSQVFPSH